MHVRTHLIYSLCSITLMHDESEIRPHFKLTHPEVKLEDYYFEYVSETTAGTTEAGRTMVTSVEDPVPEDTSSANDVKGEAPENLVTDVDVYPDMPGGVADDSTSVDSASPSDATNWTDGCEYQCQHCPMAAKIPSQISLHLRQYHGLKGLARGEGFTVLKENRIDCGVCGVSMLQNANAIKRHLRAHRVPVEEYAAKYVFGAAEAADSLEALYAQGERPAHLADDGGDGIPADVAWYNGCLFRCSLCRFESYVACTVKNHVKRCPWLGEEGVVAKKEMVRQRVYACRLCGHNVVHEKGTITGHLARRHKMSCREYEARFHPPQEVKQEDNYWMTAEP